MSAHWLMVLFVRFRVPEVFVDSSDASVAQPTPELLLKVLPEHNLNIESFCLAKEIIRHKPSTDRFCLSCEQTP